MISRGKEGRETIFSYTQKLDCRTYVKTILNITRTSSPFGSFVFANIHTFHKMWFAEKENCFEFWKIFHFRQRKKIQVHRKISTKMHEKLKINTKKKMRSPEHRITFMKIKFERSVKLRKQNKMFPIHTWITDISREKIPNRIWKLVKLKKFIITFTAVVHKDISLISSKECFWKEWAKKGIFGRDVSTWEPLRWKIFELSFTEFTSLNVSEFHTFLKITVQWIKYHQKERISSKKLKKKKNIYQKSWRKWRRLCRSEPWAEAPKTTCTRKFHGNVGKYDKITFLFHRSTYLDEMHNKFMQNRTC